MSDSATQNRNVHFMDRFLHSVYFGFPSVFATVLQDTPILFVSVDFRLAQHLEPSVLFVVFLFVRVQCYKKPNLPVLYRVIWQWRNDGIFLGACYINNHQPYQQSGSSVWLLLFVPIYVQKKVQTSGASRFHVISKISHFKHKAKTEFEKSFTKKTDDCSISSRTEKKHRFHSSPQYRGRLMVTKKSAFNLIMMQRYKIRPVCNYLVENESKFCYFIIF